MYLVALWTTMSAPCSIGRWSSGVAKVLSTTSSEPASRVAAAAAMSAIGDQRVARRLQPDHRRAAGGLGDSLRIGDVNPANAQPADRLAGAQLIA